ncbi:ADP-ribosylation factor, partial [Durusdinium trenchii]
SQTDTALDDVDQVINKYAADAEEAEMKFVQKANASITDQVQLIKKKVASVMDKARAFWRNSKQQVVRVQNIVVGTLATVGQTDTAIHLNGTLVTLLQRLDSASDSTLTVAK